MGNSGAAYENYLLPSGSYEPEPGSLLYLPVPAYWAHRGGGKLWPESTLFAVRQTHAAGLDGADLDIQPPSGEGILPVSHDDTVDRVTNGTGNVSAFTAQEFYALTVDQAPTALDAAQNHPTDMGRVFTEFGGQLFFGVEPKDLTAAQPLADLIARRRLQKTCLPNSSVTGYLAPFRALGMPTCRIDNPAAIPAATHLANGDTWVMIDVAQAATTDVQTFINAGLAIVAYGVGSTRRADLAPFLALLRPDGTPGVRIVDVDDPIYLRDRNSQLTDPWSLQRPFPGMIGNALAYDGEFSAPNWFTIRSDAALGTEQLTLQGWANMGNRTSLDIDVRFDTISTGSAYIFFLGADDQRYDLTHRRDGYAVRLRPARSTDGKAELTLVLDTAGTPGTETQIGSQLLADGLSVGNIVHLRIDFPGTGMTVTPTGLSNPGASNITSAGANAKALRGAGQRYLHLGRAGSNLQGVSFRAAVIA